VKTPAVIDTGSYCVMVGEIFFTTTLGDSFNRYNIATVYFRRLLRATAFKELMSAYCQGYSQNSHRNQGTGLGLFISKGIVEAHLGKIWGKNNVDGKGATFSFSLPTLTRY
jgi:hypothetical protein